VLEEEFVEVLLTVVEAEFCLFDVEVKGASRQAAEFDQAGFGVAPKGFDAVDVVVASGEFVLTVVDA